MMMVYGRMYRKLKGKVFSVCLLIRPCDNGGGRKNIETASVRV